MKKNIVALMCIVLMTTASHAKSYTCYRDDDKPWGCAQKTEENSGNGNYTLRCKNPGNVVCQFSDGTCPPMIIKTFADIQEDVYRNIENHIYTGKVILSFGYYTWEATDINHYKVTVIDLQE